MVDEGVRGRNKRCRADPHGKKAEIFSSVRPGSLAELPPEVSMERIGVPPEKLTNRASDATSLLFLTKTRYLELDAWPPLTAQIGVNDLVSFYGASNSRLVPHPSLCLPVE